MLVENHLETIRRGMPFAPTGGLEGLRMSFEWTLGIWFDILEGQNQSGFEDMIGRFCTTFAGRGAVAETLLDLIEATAQAVLGATLEVLDEGIPGAEEGARGVLRALDIAIGVYDEAFRRKAEAATERATILRSVAENAPDGIAIADPDAHTIYANPAFQKMLGHDVVSRGNFANLLHPDSREKLAKAAITSGATGRWEGTLRYMRADGSSFNALVTSFRVHDKNGELVARCALFRDLTDEERADEERHKLEQQIIASQEEALRELGTPLMPLAEGVLAMPIVGTIDTTRAARIIEVMLEGVVSTGAGHVIMDITGVPVVTAEVADAIARAAKAAELVGAEVVLTGIRGAVAKTLLELDVDLGGSGTWSTLRGGVAHAFAHERAKARRRA